jgi:hypothetical protein
MDGMRASDEPSGDEKWAARGALSTPREISGSAHEGHKGIDHEARCPASIASLLDPASPGVSPALSDSLLGKTLPMRRRLAAATREMCTVFHQRSKLLHTTSERMSEGRRTIKISDQNVRSEGSSLMTCSLD